jgi:hypothetical protein
MNSAELQEFKHGFKKIYDLPYTSNSGVHFSDNGVSMVTQYGIVFADNGYLGKEKYYPVLWHHGTTGDGSISYDTHVDVQAKGNSDLDILGRAIVDNLKRNAEAILREIS